MKTVVCSKVGQLDLVDTPAPSPGPGEATVRISRIGVCGTDLHAFKGRQPFFTYPRVLGHELAGRIEAMGTPEPTQSRLRVGDRVTVMPYLSCGTCIACRAGKTNCCVTMRVIGVHEDGGMKEVMTVPVSCLLGAEGLTDDEAALVECLAIGAHAVRRAAISASEHALIIGSGPIGLSVMQFARVAGAQVTAMDINDQRLAFCRDRLHVDHTLNAQNDAMDALKFITGGDMPTLIFDATGNAKSMSNCINYLAHSGRIVFVSLVQGDVALTDAQFHKREATLLRTRNATGEDFAHVIQCLKDKAVDASCYITHRAGLEDVPRVFENWTDPSAGVVKAMIQL